jgi:hypothetical protein
MKKTTTIFGLYDSDGELVRAFAFENEAEQYQNRIRPDTAKRRMQWGKEQCEARAAVCAGAAVRLAQAGYPKGADYSRFAEESKLFTRLASYFGTCRGMTI